MMKTVLCLILLSGCCLAANETAVDSKEVTTTILPTLSNKADEKENNSSRQDKAIEEEDDDLVIIVAGAPRLDDNDDVVVINGGQEGRAIVIDGIPVDNAAPGQAGFKLFKADDIKDKNGHKDEKEGRIKVLDDIPTDNSDSDSAGFRLPLAGNASEPRIIEFLVAEEEEDFAPKSLKGSESVDDIIIIEVGDSVEESEVDCFADREPGTCDKSEKAYFYDHETNKCQFFLYSGCGGNSNRFASEAECESRCKDAKRGEKDQNKKVCGTLAPACEEECTLVKGDSECLECSCTKVDPKVCTEPHGKRGVCRALLLSWTYNPETKECEAFTYGGCEAGASKNRFKTQELCQATCVPKEEV